MFKALHSFTCVHHKYCPLKFISRHWYLDSNVVFKVYVTQKGKSNVKTAGTQDKVKYAFVTTDKMSCMANFSQDQNQKALGFQTYATCTVQHTHISTGVHAHTHAHTFTHQTEVLQKEFHTCAMIFTSSDYVHVWLW